MSGGGGERKGEEGPGSVPKFRRKRAHYCAKKRKGMDSLHTWAEAKETE